MTATRAAALPRVNLLPPEIAEAEKFRRTQFLLGGLVLLTVFLVGALWWSAHQSVAAANADLTVAQTETTALQAEAAKYANVPETYAAVATAQAQLVVAMTPEIRWSFYLNDLSLTMPSGVRLVSLSAIEPYASGTPGTSVQTTTGAEGAQGIGSVTYVGKASSYDDVAAWLQAQKGQKGMTEPYPSTAGNPPDQATKGQLVDWTTSVTITADALSHRYDKWGK
jgi:Tfp pilus assembly protein PilN